MAVPSASPGPAQAALPALGRCLCSVCAPVGGVGGGDSWGRSELQLLPAVGVSLSVWCLNYFHFVSASLPGPAKDTNG